MGNLSNNVKKNGFYCTDWEKFAHFDHRIAIELEKSVEVLDSLINIEKRKLKDLEKLNESQKAKQSSSKSEAESKIHVILLRDLLVNTLFKPC